MVRTKRQQQTAQRSSSRKRALEENNESTPTKRRSGRSGAGAGKQSDNSRSEYDFPSDDDAEAQLVQQIEQETPKRRTRGPAAKPIDERDAVSTPRHRKGKATLDVATPSRSKTTVNGQTPRRQRLDRSARKKSARALIEKVVADVSSDEEADQGIAREIYDSSEDDEDQEDAADATDGLNGQDTDNEDIPDEVATPSKRPRGRPKTTQPKKGGRPRKKSPTPPRDLPPHELYFAQNRPGAAKTSNNTLASLQLLTHEEYFSTLRDYDEPHKEDVKFLDSIHVQSFPQWIFELSQGFGICLYGYGSKRALLHKFARHLYDSIADHASHRIVIVNGYVHANMSSLRDILSVVSNAVDPKHKLAAGGPSVMMDSLKRLLAAHEITVTVILNSIDAAPLRRPGFQSILAQLAALPQIQFICSADTPDFTLLWDSGLRSSFGFVFHDCTTFAPFTAELEVVDDVHELLGRKARRVGGKEGVTYVLRSLTENARNLYRLLVGEVLVAMDNEDDASGENPGVEYRMIYNKAVEEFICSSEMAFRTLLKEFHDHQMITSRKDVLGTELLSVPFRKEELEAILEDIA
ncbi:origin recognition complex subunit 2-domain-containing protein [Nemania sp. FL0916]|nr:origin recognition complex subunit 2-domain-containing protein [Nemania sp. FL0916]